MDADVRGNFMLHFSLKRKKQETEKELRGVYNPLNTLHDANKCTAGFCELSLHLFKKMQAKIIMNGAFVKE